MVGGWVCVEHIGAVGKHNMVTVSMRVCASVVSLGRTKIGYL